MMIGWALRSGLGLTTAAYAWYNWAQQSPAEEIWVGEKRVPAR